MGIFTRLLRNRLDTPLVRVGLVFISLATVSAFIGVRVAKAQAGAALGTLAEQMLAMAPPNPHGATQAIKLNGFELGLRVQSLRMSREDGIRMVADECRLRSGMMDAPLDNGSLDTLRQSGTAEVRNGADGIMIQDTPQGTIVACIDTDGTSWLSHEMFAQLKRFMDSGELAEIGVVRYTLVRGGDERATLVRMWSEGRAPILKMFPKGRDVPGNDHAFVPRVGGRRVLSAQVAESQLLSYQHPTETVDEVWAKLAPELARADVLTSDMASAAPGKRVWVRQGLKEALVTVISVKGMTYLSVFEAP